MSKNKKKRNSTSKQIHKNKEQIIAEQKFKKTKSSLPEKLREIYEDEIDLSTTQSCKCICCKIAMPQINHCEFEQIVSVVWQNFSGKEKLDILVGCVDYFFKHDFEKCGIDSLIKPCLLLDRDTGLCKVYEDRPLSCRMFGQWPEDIYQARVDRFEKAYEKYGLKKEDLPLFSQCEKVKRFDESVPMTEEVIEKLYERLDNLDRLWTDGNGNRTFSDSQIRHKENYRTFHDWLLLRVYGEEVLSAWSTFIMAADEEAIYDQIEKMKEAVRDYFSKNEMIKL